MIRTTKQEFTLYDILDALEIEYSKEDTVNMRVCDGRDPDSQMYWGNYNVDNLNSSLDHFLTIEIEQR